VVLADFAKHFGPKQNKQIILAMDLKPVGGIQVRK